MVMVCDPLLSISMLLLYWQRCNLSKCIGKHLSNFFPVLNTSESLAGNEMFSIMVQILLRINCYIKVTFKRETPLPEKHLIVNVISLANFWITTTWILFWESLTDIFYQSSHRVLYSSDSVHDVSAETSLAEWLIRAVNIFFFSLGKLSLTNP